MLFIVLKMLKKKLGIEGIEKDWPNAGEGLEDFFKIPPKLIIPESCWKIGYAAFWCCSELRKVIIPKSVERIENGAFNGCRKATIILKKSKKNFVKIGINVFHGCKVRHVKEKVRN